MVPSLLKIIYFHRIYEVRIIVVAFCCHSLCGHKTSFWKEMLLQINLLDCLIGMLFYNLVNYFLLIDHTKCVKKFFLVPHSWFGSVFVCILHVNLTCLQTSYTILEFLSFLTFSLTEIPASWGKSSGLVLHSTECLIQKHTHYFCCINIVFKFKNKIDPVLFLILTALIQISSVQEIRLVWRRKKEYSP